jgi:hypothetical protein
MRKPLECSRNYPPPDVYELAGTFVEILLPFSFLDFWNDKPGTGND